MYPPPRKWIRLTSPMSSGVTCSMSPCMIHSNPSRTPSTSTASRRARIVAAPMTLLIPGAGPPPTRIASVFRSVIAFPSHEGLGIGRRKTERLGDCWIDHLALDYVEAEEQRRVVFAGLLPPIPGQPLRVREGRVREPEGRGARHAPRHVGHTIMNDPVHHVHRVLVRRGLDGLDAAALIHRHVHDDRPRLHELEVVTPHQLRGLGPRQQDGPD